MKLLKLTECGREFGLPIRWLKHEAKLGQLPSLKIGRRVFFERDAVEKVLAQRAAQGDNADGR